MVHKGSVDQGGAERKWKVHILPKACKKVAVSRFTKHNFK